MSAESDTLATAVRGAGAMRAWARLLRRAMPADREGALA